MHKFSFTESLELGQRFREAAFKLGTREVDAEFEYFKENARRFELEDDPDKRYGILIQGTAQEEKNMLYANDPLKLRILHLEALTRQDTGTTGHKVRKHLDWLERLEGKQ